MGIFRMYTGDDSKSVMEELQIGDPILDALSRSTSPRSSQSSTLLPDVAG